MTGISLGIVVFAFLIPLYVVPVALGVSDAANCTDYSCANARFTECGGFSSSKDDSNDFMESWANGMEGMMCMIGLKTSSSVNAYYQFTP